MDVEIVGKFLSTLPEDDDHPYRTGPWRPQTTEWDADDLTVVEGEIPSDLDGVYLRNTENPLHPALKFYHPFDGDGMVHVVGFRDGKAFYRNRFIRTDGFAEENEAGGPLWPGLAEPVQIAKRDRGWGARTLMKDASSTDVIVHRGTALTSFYQCGDLYRVDPYSGDTLGKASAPVTLTVFEAARVTVNALHPATFMPTKVSPAPPASTIAQGVEATLRLITAPPEQTGTGRYFNRLEESRANDQAYDPDARRQLRALSASLAGI